MTAFKPLEVVAKWVLAALAAVVLWRPGRKARALLLAAHPKKVLLVRIDDRVGEALLTTPLFDALKALPEPPRVHALVHERAARVLKGHPHLDAVLPFDRRCLVLGALAPGLRALRRERYDAVVNCASWAEASVTAAIVSRLAAPAAALIGPAVFPSGWLADLKVPPLPDTRSEAEQRANLVSPLGTLRSPARLTFRAPAPTPRVREFLEAHPGARAVVNPGGRLGYRRVPPQVFAATCRALTRGGVRPLVTWGPGEEALADEVLRAAPGAVRAPPTDLDELAWLLQQSKLAVCNNTGPMHLSVAVGTPTLGLFLHMDAERWGHSRAPHAMIDLTPLADRPDEMERAAVAAVEKLAASVS